jgi:hypothetical protein
MEKHVPNHIPVKNRVINSIIGIIIIIYASIGLYKGEIHIPLSPRGSGITFIGSTAIFAAIALIFVAIFLLIVVVDHYDKRDNEKYYRYCGNFCIVCAVLFIIIGTFFNP